MKKLLLGLRVKVCLHFTSQCVLRDQSSLYDHSCVALMNVHALQPPACVPSIALRRPAKGALVLHCLQLAVRKNYCVILRPAGGVNHPDSDLAKVGKLPAKKALR